MMKYMKYLLLLVAVMIFTSTLGWADIVGNENVKLTIFAHTGQDPVHRSLGFPVNEKHLPGDIWSLDKQKIIKEITNDFTVSVDWLNIFDTPTTISSDVASVIFNPYTGPVIFDTYAGFLRRDLYTGSVLHGTYADLMKRDLFTGSVTNGYYTGSVMNDLYKGSIHADFVIPFRGVGGGGNIPSPPAFPLLLLGFASLMRRRN